MKRLKLIPLIILLFVIAVLPAQMPINYKALVKDNLGNVMSNQGITIQFTILKGAGMTNVYQESHNPVTDGNGMAMVNIGEGSVLSGVFADIDWGSDDHYLNVQLDTGSGLIDLGTTQFMAVPYAIQATNASNVTGLEKITENSNPGWRLIGSSPNNFADIGFRAVDLSISEQVGNINGASGNYSFATGLNNEATGQFSTAGGRLSSAQGDYSFSSGYFTEATGQSSFSMGSNSQATGDYSIALGYNNTASGITSAAIGGENNVASGTGSFAFGDFNTASGANSFALGYLLNAESAFSIALGRSNIGGGSPGSWVSTDPLLEVGNGFGGLDNALTILKNGNVGIDTNTPDVRLQITGGSDVSLGGTNGYFTMGEINGFNLSMDNNEIMARNNGSSTPLYLQGEGGEIVAGGSINLNDIFTTGVALKVNGDEALWYNGTYFSWGFGGTANYFADNIGIGTTSPLAPLDIEGSGDVGIRVNLDGPSGSAIYALNTSTTGNNYALLAENQSTDGTGIFSVGLKIGVKAVSFGLNSIGVYGDAGGTNSIGVMGDSSDIDGGFGVVGEGHTGVYGNSGNLNLGNGVRGKASANNGQGVRGEATGESGKAIYGEATGLYGKGIHVKVTSTHSSANGILSEWGGGSSYAGYFIGRVHVAGTLSKSSGSFKIDHPLDPENKYLSHSYVESPDMMNVYNGNVTTNEEGKAEVKLPEYFEALNTDFRYQLTVMGQFAQAIISKKISGNSFEIMTDHPNVEVSWQVTGIRNDAYAQKNRIPVEEIKEDENKGRYLNPEAFNVDPSRAIGRSVSKPVQQ